MRGRKATVRGRPAIRRALGALAAAVLLSGCVTVRYERSGRLAGESYGEVLELSGSAFRFERTSDLGATAFTGSFEVRGEEWRFLVEGVRPAGSAAWKRFRPPLLYRYRGRAFVNGIAFYSAILPRDAAAEPFIRVPCDFDVADRGGVLTPVAAVSTVGERGAGLPVREGG